MPDAKPDAAMQKSSRKSTRDATEWKAIVALETNSSFKSRDQHRDSAHPPP
jgi:hypothetical protein